MTIEKLKRYVGISANIDAIEAELSTLYSPVRSPTGSSSGHSTSPGDPTGRTVAKIIRMKELLEKQKEEMYGLVEEIETWLATVEDYEIVAIIRCRFMLRYSWNKVGQKLYGVPNGDMARKKLERFLNESGE